MNHDLAVKCFVVYFYSGILKCPYLVYTFQVDVVAGEAKCDFSADTDISWEDFHRLVITYMDSSTAVQLAYKISGDNGRASHLNSARDFMTAMERLSQRACSACSWPVSMEVKNIVSMVFSITKEVISHI